MATVGKHMRRLRAQRRVTQEELAEKLYVTRQAVSARETGKAQPDLETLERIAKALNVPVTTLIYGEDSAVKLQQMKKKWMLFGIGISIIIALMFIILVKMELCLHGKKDFAISCKAPITAFPMSPCPVAGAWNWIWKIWKAIEGKCCMKMPMAAASWSARSTKRHLISTGYFSGRMASVIARGARWCPVGWKQGHCRPLLLGMIGPL